MNILVILLVFCLIVFLGFRSSEAKRNKKIEEIFAGRARLTDEEFYKQYYGESNISEDIVLRVTTILGDHLDADHSRLDKDDSFLTNLAFFFDDDDMVDVEIIIALEHVFSIEISDEEAINMHSVDDIIQFVVRKI